MNQKEIEILLLALLRLLTVEDRKRLHYSLEGFRFGRSCGDTNADLIEANERDISINYLQRVIVTPVEDLL